MSETSDNLEADIGSSEERIFEGQSIERSWSIVWGFCRGANTRGLVLGLRLGKKMKRKVSRSMWKNLRLIVNTWLQEIKTRKDPIWCYLFTYSVGTIGSASSSHT